MSVFQINACNFGSTGNIMMQIAHCARTRDIPVYTCCSVMRSNKAKADAHTFFIGNILFRKFFEVLENLFGIHGFLHFFSTLKLINRMEQEKCTLIHIHNLHGNYINYPLLFRYIKKHNIPVIWTLHDCWSFTGRCPYFVMTKCDCWKSGCHDCPYPKKSYPRSNIDTTRMMWKLKHKWFTGIKNCTLVTPSQWLADLVKQSYLKNYNVKVINNGIDLSVFKPSDSNFREIYGLVGKKVILGVAFGWGKRKGFDVFIELVNRLPDDYRIVLVGTDDNVDKELPTAIISIHRTQNQKELAQIYTAADVFANPTREEVLGLVNIESLACGTPVVTFRTGGSPECIDETCGSIVDCDDVDAMESEIQRICKERPYSVEACLKRARSFDMNDKFEEYVDLYQKMQF